MLTDKQQEGLNEVQLSLLRMLVEDFGFPALEIVRFAKLPIRES